MGRLSFPKKGTPMELISEATPIASQSEKTSSEFVKNLRSPLTFGLVSCGGVGAFLFTVTYIIEGFLQPGYNAWQQSISALSLGPGGWVQQLNFVVFGLLTLLSAYGWHRLLTPGKYSIVFPLYQAVAGIGLIGVAWFTSGTIHIILAFMLIIAFADGCIVLARRFTLGPRWRGWAVYSAMSSALIFVFWISFVTGSAGSAAGFVERLSAGSHALWICLLVVTLFFRRRRIEKTMK
jgi:hypothetical protein